VYSTPYKIPEYGSVDHAPYLDGVLAKKPTDIVYGSLQREQLGRFTKIIARVYI
jgi:hypothetical protein